MASDVVGPDNRGLVSYINRQASDSIEVVLLAGSFSCIVYMLTCQFHSDRVNNPTGVMMVNLGVLMLFCAAAVAVRKFRVPEPVSHLALSMVGIIIFCAASLSALYGMTSTFSDLVIITIVASGAFVLDYYWLAFLNLTAMSVWYWVCTALSTGQPRSMEVSSVTFAIITSFLLCHIRRTTYQRQYGFNKRQQLVSEKLEGIYAETGANRAELNNTLADLDRTKGDLNEQLKKQRAALKRLEQRVVDSRASESLGRLAGGVAHDFNNLLTVLFFNIDELLESSSDEEVSTDLKEARHAAEKVTELTSQLLALSRRQVLKTQTVNPERHLKKLYPTIQKLLGEDTKLLIEVELPEDDFELQADPDLLDRVLLTLVGSARTSKSRGGEVRITLGLEENDLSYRITHGKSSIRVSKSMSRAFSLSDDLLTSLGLSLAAVEGVLEQHNGSFNASSDGSLTHYDVRLPLISEENPLQLGESNFGDQPISGSVVLLEEDEQVRRLIKRHLLKAKLDVYDFESLRQFKEGLKELDNVAILICDYLQPTSDGPTLSEELRQRWPQMKTIYMTGPEVNSIKNPAAEVLDTYLPKPFSLRKLGDSVNAFVTAS